MPVASFDRRGVRLVVGVVDLAHPPGAELFGLDLDPVLLHVLLGEAGQLLVVEGLGPERALTVIAEGQIPTLEVRLPLTGGGGNVTPDRLLQVVVGHALVNARCGGGVGLLVRPASYLPLVVAADLLCVGLAPLPVVGELRVPALVGGLNDLVALVVPGAPGRVEGLLRLLGILVLGVEVVPIRLRRHLLVEEVVVALALPGFLQ